MKYFPNQTVTQNDGTQQASCLTGGDNPIETLNDQLNSCPFCGGRQTSNNRSVLDTIQIAQGSFAIVCSCGANGPAETSQEKARKAWNKRSRNNKSLWWDPYRFLRYAAPGEFRGNLKSVSFSAILQLLSSEAKSGILHTALGAKRSRISLKSGGIVSATCNEGPQLGQILLDKGLISRPILQQSLTFARMSGKLLGETLLSSKHVSHEALVEAIHVQVRAVVMDVMFLAGG